MRKIVCLFILSFIFMMTSCTIVTYDKNMVNQYFTDEMIELHNMVGLPKLDFQDCYLASDHLLYFNDTPTEEWYIQILDWLDSREDITYWGSFVHSPNFMYDEPVYKYDSYEKYIGEKQFAVVFTTEELNEEDKFQNAYEVIVEELGSPHSIKGSNLKYSYWLQIVTSTNPLKFKYQK